MLKRLKGILIPAGFTLTAGALYLKRALLRRQAVAVVGTALSNPVPVVLTLSLISDPLVLRISYNLIYIFFRGIGSWLYPKNDPESTPSSED